MITRVSPTRISTRIADAIKRDITSGALQAGDRLPPERTMVKRHRVSRVTVREAYRALQDAGILTVRRGSSGGAFVSAPASTRISEALSIALRLDAASDRQVREAGLIEPVVAGLAARHASPAYLARLRKIVARSAPSIRPGTFEQHRTRFHLAIADGASNVALAAVVGSLARVSGAMYGALEYHEGFVARAGRWHCAVADAIAAHDEAAASGAMRSYLLWLNDFALTSRAGLARRPDPADRAFSAA